MPRGGCRSTATGGCGTCTDARGISADEWVEGAKRGSMDAPTEWNAGADHVLVFLCPPAP
jgi:sulfur relay (sulfurtransferase) complex TusBCD TusD component (DsrE family)